MPRTYIRVLLVFQTAASTSPITQHLQHGLNKLLKQVPWLSGRVFPSTSNQHKASLEIRSHEGNAPTLVDKGSIAASYAILSPHGFSMETIPSKVWPVPSIIDDNLFATAAPVFAASLFRFADRGVGTTKAPTTNVVIYALLWTSITRVRTRRRHHPSALESNEPSRLVTAINDRQRLYQGFPGPEHPYLALASADEDPVRALATICDRIAESQSPARVNSRYIAEAYGLVDFMEDYRRLFVGRDMFGSRDLTITN
ncbi:uncharacterized protein BO97DRAFT_429897 [Aspergillus homomorphus CBS 101889]|uniref:Trichothecene 3-O-acetyltransferase-like N-terminal domain-containing protein n=1 Tax=Aspergillus homomorphus (strain CBS 101889) TaxID=1450537 RepID=A0A395HI37_ASPHC|nr:hypothetical protein BO97DRAFT_429897 [Aspergillus homomorphus CBS 101889]RAL06835.1 hypothetical protein BO97DRAFT_429897 [Aspergillus homomorphus CBS 101889]